MEHAIVKYLSILKACKVKLPWWKHFFSPSSLTSSLGKKFQQAREEKKLSVDEVAAKIFVSPSVIIALEAGEYDQDNVPSSLHPGYCRLMAVAYARLLDLNINEIHTLLPPPASLKSSTFIKKLSPLQAKPRKPHFMRVEQPQLAYSMKGAKNFLWKVFVIIVAIISALYVWGIVRHFMRLF